ncbi:MAG TPA: serine/threonine-protein kinase [Caulobacteraceae bacterium]|jgi:serine/threonine-protein kinase|nr:serine/threonine-protein kinase [Caulobacteraceae bacterium]
MTAESDAPNPDQTIFQPGLIGKGGVQTGTLLNGIFEVRSLLARGGMGEVYEGVNINTDERVAIKIILSHLASDPQIQALFKNEAQTLVRLSHQALVQYRVLGREPQLDVYYIVTEFIDGPVLTSVYTKLKPSVDDLKGLIRRLAEGLNSAHQVGKIHRDMSLDNIMLPGGNLGQAKIIDFGIVKDLDPNKGTIVGDNFAGRLGFASPEQFGSFKRDIGPWTDVYSLGLVVLTVAAGHAIDMGSNLADALDKRRQAPDLTDAPAALRPLLAKMLEPDPANRLRSMTEVIEMLDGGAGGGSGGNTGSSTRQRNSGGAQPIRQKIIKERQPLMPRLAIGGGVVVVLAMLAVLVGMPMLKSYQANQAASRSTPEALRAAVTGSLATIDCAWLDVAEPKAGDTGVMTVKLSGLAGDPDAVSKQAASAITTAGLKANVNVDDVNKLDAKACGPLNVFRKFREPPSAAGPSLTTQNSVYQLQAQPPGCDPAAGRQARALTTLNVPPPADFTLLGMEPSGRIQQLIADRNNFNTDMTANPALFQEGANGSLVSYLCVDEKTAERTPIVIEVLVKGQKPFNLAPLSTSQSDAMDVDSDWQDRFAAAARIEGWTTQIAWFRVVK